MSKSTEIAEAIDGITQARAAARLHHRFKAAQAAWVVATNKASKRILRGAANQEKQRQEDKNKNNP